MWICNGPTIGHLKEQNHQQQLSWWSIATPIGISFHCKGKGIHANHHFSFSYVSKGSPIPHSLGSLHAFPHAKPCFSIQSSDWLFHVFFVLFVYYLLLVLFIALYTLYFILFQTSNCACIQYIFMFVYQTSCTCYYYYQFEWWSFVGHNLHYNWPYIIHM